MLVVHWSEQHGIALRRKLHQFGNNIVTMGTFAICARNAAKSVAWEFSRSGKLRKYGGSTFSCKVNNFLAAPCLLSVGVFADDLKNLNWPQAMLQTKRWRSTLRSSCTSRFTRRFPPRWLKSRWNHSSCSDNSHTQTNKHTHTDKHTHRQHWLYTDVNTHTNSQTQ